ncbi:MAG TPA: LysR family transcriptional regulator [Roseiarcus sp.]|nr:LysR family transcriptional regulator [Roseiarcus sp.]
MIDALTLDQMRIFVAAVDEGSFSAAARKLGRVQSAVSQSVAALEGHLGVALFDRSGKTPRLTPAGVALAKDARRLLEGAVALKRRAACIADKVEPELVLAVDGIFPHQPLIASLKALRDEFPAVPVSIFTETLGGSEQRLRDGVAQFAIYPMPPSGFGDLAADFLAAIDILAVVSVDHPLASEPEPIARETLEPHVQLVLTDRTPLTQNFSGGIVSHHIWRFADLSTRLEFLLAGFGWCRMPAHLVVGPIAGGRLKALKLAESSAFQFLAHVVHVRGQEIGRAGRWLIEDLRARMAERRPSGTGAGPPRQSGPLGRS